MPSKKRSLESIYIQPSQQNDENKSLSSSIFEHNSFQIFHSKISKALKAEGNLQILIKDLNQALKMKATKKEQMLEKEQLTNSGYLNKRNEIEKWVQVERTEISAVQRHLM